MNRILEREALNPTVTRLKVEAPLIARKAEPDSSSFCGRMRTASGSR